MGRTSGPAAAELLGGLGLLGVFLAAERRAAEPMFHLHLLAIRVFSAGNLASLLSSVARGGFMFMLIIWLQALGSRSTAFRLPPHRCGPRFAC